MGVSLKLLCWRHRSKLFGIDLSVRAMKWAELRLYKQNMDDGSFPGECVANDFIQPSATRFR